MKGMTSESILGNDIATFGFAFGGNFYYHMAWRYLIMANVEKVSIALTVDMAAVVREAVASGEYASSSEVVRDALRDWKLKRSLRRTEIEHLRGLWEEGLASGAGQFSDMDAIKREARTRLARSKP
jgi:antitoxin ParD1/3/4